MRAKMSSYLSNSSNAVRCFGLLGMGGSGKTTTAVSIYNKIHKQFEASFFSMNTRARVAADASSLETLRREILNSFLSNKKGEESSALRGIYGLVVLDDVDSKAQVDALYISLCSSLRSNSVVLITSRYREVLQHAQPTYIFDMGALSPESSQWLFNWHAFLKPEAPPHLQKVSKSVIAACKGLPLSLKVMGAHLYPKSDKRDWDESLTYLTKHQEDIFSVLKLSLGGLKSDQLDSFLDISCFFVGQNDVVTRAYMEGVYEVASTHLSSLNSRCLLSLKAKEEEYCDIEDTTIEVHDQIRDMGRHIVRKEKRNRAWDEETAKDLLKDETTRSALRGLSINSGMTLPCEAAKCESLPRLYFLRVIDDGNNSAGKVLIRVRCEELRLLVWRNAPFSEVPPGLCSINLRVLDLRDSKVCELPPAPCFMELRYLDLEGTNISSVPHGIFFVNLEYMNLSRTKIKELRSGLQCPNLRRLFLSKTQISQVPHGLYSTNLEVLDLSWTNISKVPDACLPNLLLLNLHGCKGLSLSAKFDTSLTSLQLLNLGECGNLEGLHSSIQSLTDLRRLDLTWCESMRSLPQEMTKLASLEILHLRYCNSLETLSFLPTTLQQLELIDCDSLQTINASLPNLQLLHIFRCNKLTTLPTGLGASMQELRLTESHGVAELLETNPESIFGELASLEILILRSCKSLETLSFLPTTLQQLELIHCDSLQTINASLPNLQRLHISTCEKLTTLPTGLGASMRQLSLSDCHGLAELLETNPESIFGELASLEILILLSCKSLETINASLPNLQLLQIFYCDKLTTLPTGLGASLEILHLWSCNSLETLSFLRTTLQKLKLHDCDSLQTLNASLPNLQLLEIHGCRKLTTLQASLPNLQLLEIHGCRKLTTLQASLPNLQLLEIFDCDKLTTLPTGLGNPMRKLRLSRSELLETNPESIFRELASLEILHLWSCNSLETLSFLPTTLQELKLHDCDSLQTLNASLPNLQLLEILDCDKLTTLPTGLGASMQELRLTESHGVAELLETNPESIFGEVASLEILHLWSCNSLETLSFLPTTLQELKLHDCDSLQTLNASLPNLQQLNLEACHSLQTINASLPNLQLLSIIGCRKLTTLPTGHGASMRELRLSDCRGVEELLETNPESIFGELASLEILILRSCKSLETLSFLPTTLQQLELIHCDSLQTINASLPNLQRLHISTCEKLTTLPTGLGASMRQLSLSDCHGLAELLETNPESIFGGSSSTTHF
ncbi:hypothetical protein KP509_15G027900 [Ceratopteris richardii]|nr:hypothetical protein KP509_15G027900 [Ceratopteris richardii]